MWASDDDKGRRLASCAGMDPGLRAGAFTRPPPGMAASDTNPTPDPPAAGELACLSASELMQRIEEEISRAARLGAARPRPGPARRDYQQLSAGAGSARPYIIGSRCLPDPSSRCCA